MSHVSREKRHHRNPKLVNLLLRSASAPRRRGTSFAFSISNASAFALNIFLILGGQNAMSAILGTSEPRVDISSSIDDDQQPISLSALKWRRGLVNTGPLVLADFVAAFGALLVGDGAMSQPASRTFHLSAPTFSRCAPQSSCRKRFLASTGKVFVRRQWNCDRRPPQFRRFLRRSCWSERRAGDVDRYRFLPPGSVAWSAFPRCGGLSGVT